MAPKLGFCLLDQGSYAPTTTCQSPGRVENEKWSYNPAKLSFSPVGNTSNCLQNDSESKYGLLVNKCDDNQPQQKWVLDNNLGKIKSPDGQCLTYMGTGVSKLSKCIEGTFDENQTWFFTGYSPPVTPVTPVPPVTPVTPVPPTPATTTSNVLTYVIIFLIVVGCLVIAFFIVKFFKDRSASQSSYASPRSGYEQLNDF